MASFIVAFDEQDSNLGSYFEKSKDDLISFIEQLTPNSSIIELSSDHCTGDIIDSTLPRINQANFLFVAYCHGTNDSLLANSNAYISSATNPYLFSNCLFFSSACSCGSDLGQRLIADACHAFIGYVDESYILSEQEDLSIACDNHAIKSFIQHDMSLNDALVSMKDFLTTQIDVLVDSGEGFDASFLRKNRDGLVLLGDGEIKFSEF